MHESIDSIDESGKNDDVDVSVDLGYIMSWMQETPPKKKRMLHTGAASLSQ
jgi:hypothetical protein